MTNPQAGIAPAFLNDVQGVEPSAATLEQISKKVAELRDAVMEITDLEERLATAKGRKTTLETVTLPDMMASAKMRSFGLDAEGNNLAYDVTVEPLVRASIAASWDDAKRQAGFKVLTDLGGQSLIKTVITFEFDPTEREAAAKFIEDVFDAHGYEGKEQLSVNHNTLSSWLKTETQAEPPRMPSPAQLQAIGGFVGRIAKIKKRSEGKRK